MKHSLASPALSSAASQASQQRRGKGALPWQCQTRKGESWLHTPGAAVHRAQFQLYWKEKGRERGMGALGKLCLSWRWIHPRFPARSTGVLPSEGTAVRCFLAGTRSIKRREGWMERGLEELGTFRGGFGGAVPAWDCLEQSCPSVCAQLL